MAGLASIGCIGDPPNKSGKPAATSAAPKRAATPPVPLVEVPRTKAAADVVIDGVLSEPAWASAAATQPFVEVSSGRAMPQGPLQGRARLMYDATHLYVAVEASDTTVTGGFPPAAKDPHLWTRDTVEIMIDPDGDGDNRDYYEVQINPQNLVFDSRFDSYNQPRGGPHGPFGHQDWSAQAVSAVKIAGTIDDDSDRDDGYTVEAKLPWSSFAKAKHAPPRSGDTWRMNFYTMQRGGAMAWSPILRRGNFHRAPRFGRVRFR